MLQVIPGLEKLVLREWSLRFGDPGKVRILRGQERNASLVLPYAGTHRDLKSLRLVEDVFLLLAEREKLPYGQESLDRSEEALRESPFLDEAIAGYKAWGNPTIPRNRIPYRVIARSDASGGFSRYALQRHVQKALEDRRKPAWIAGGEGSPVEIWVQYQQNHFLVMLRLSDRTLRHRTYKTEHIPGSLRPSMAAALVLLSDPKPRDRFVDPMCGAGTIPLERTLWGDARLVIGGDVNEEAVEASWVNAQGIKSPPVWLRWDAGRLPFEDYSIDKIVTNLPFGGKQGAGTDLNALYRNLLRECERVLRPQGKAVFFTSQRRILLRQMQRGTERLQMGENFQVRILGKRSFIVETVKR